MVMFPTTTGEFLTVADVELEGVRPADVVLVVTLAGPAAAGVVPVMGAAVVVVVVVLVTVVVVALGAAALEVVKRLARQLEGTLL